MPNYKQIICNKVQRRTSHPCQVNLDFKLSTLLNNKSIYYLTKRYHSCLHQIVQWLHPWSWEMGETSLWIYDLMHLQNGKWGSCKSQGTCISLFCSIKIGCKKITGKILKVWDISLRNVTTSEFYKAASKGTCPLPWGILSGYQVLCLLWYQRERRSTEVENVKLLLASLSKKCRWHYQNRGSTSEASDKHNSVMCLVVMLSVTFWPNMYIQLQQWQRRTNCILLS
jgi:hypothetical protein